MMRDTIEVGEPRVEDLYFVIGEIYDWNPFYFRFEFTPDFVFFRPVTLTAEERKEFEPDEHGNSFDPRELFMPEFPAPEKRQELLDRMNNGFKSFDEFTMMFEVPSRN